jgi:flagellar secretion chaperone FliS
MFASTHSPRSAHAGALSGMYRQVGISTSVDGASSHRLVAMLFDGLIEALAEARGALANKDIEAKCRSLSKASRIVDEGLRAGLNLEAGGAMSRQLDALYGYISSRLLHANLKSDAAAVDECRRLIEPVRDAWQQIGAQVSPTAALPAARV